jgi:hypothetical protein
MREGGAMKKPADDTLREAIKHLERVRSIISRPIKKVSLASMQADFANEFTRQFATYDNENPSLAQGRATHLLGDLLRKMFDIPEDKGPDEYDVEVQFLLKETDNRIYVGPEGHYVKKKGYVMPSKPRP